MNSFERRCLIALLISAVALAVFQFGFKPPDLSLERVPGSQGVGAAPQD